jgi:hypothetical protein
MNEMYGTVSTSELLGFGQLFLLVSNILMASNYGANSDVIWKQNLAIVDYWLFLWLSFCTFIADIWKNISGTLVSFINVLLIFYEHVSFLMP